MWSAPNPRVRSNRVAAASAGTSGPLPYLIRTSSPLSSVQSNLGDVPPRSPSLNLQLSSSRLMSLKDARVVGTVGGFHTWARRRMSSRTSSVTLRLSFVIGFGAAASTSCTNGGVGSFRSRKIHAPATTAADIAPTRAIRLRRTPHMPIGNARAGPATSARVLECHLLFRRYELHKEPRPSVVALFVATAVTASGFAQSRPAPARPQPSRAANR